MIKAIGTLTKDACKEYWEERYYLGGLAAFIVAGGALIFWGDARDKQRKQDLVQKVSLVADKDGINGTTPEEWNVVYNELGKVYQVGYSNPERDLSERELNKYLEGQSQ